MSYNVPNLYPDKGFLNNKSKKGLLFDKYKIRFE